MEVHILIMGITFPLITKSLPLADDRVPFSKQNDSFRHQSPPVPLLSRSPEPTKAHWCRNETR